MPDGLLIWLRGLDLNQRPSGYEPDELPGCSTPRQSIGLGRPGSPCTFFLIFRPRGWRRCGRKGGCCSTPRQPVAGSMPVILRLCKTKRPLPSMLRGAAFYPLAGRFRIEKLCNVRLADLAATYSPAS